MTEAVIIIGLLLHGSLCAYYLVRFFSKRDPISLVLFGMTFGWMPVYLFRTGRLPHSVMGWILYGGIVVGVLHLIAVANIESQRR